MKAEHMPVEPHFSRYRAQLAREAAELMAAGWNGRTALCLGARHGGEVAGLRDAGLFAFGIDVEVPRGNIYSATGDFHDLNLPPGTVDLVFTNCFDHVADVQDFLRSLAKVVAPAGRLLAHVSHGFEDSPPGQPSLLDSLWWNHWTDIIGLLRRTGFDCLSDKPLDYPFRSGTRQIVFAPRIT